MLVTPVGVTGVVGGGVIFLPPHPIIKATANPASAKIFRTRTVRGFRAARRLFVGARYIVPGKLTWRDASHPPRTHRRLMWSAAACRRCLPHGLARACSSHSPHA